MVHIYGLKEKGTSELRYIGHSKNVKKRIYQHKTKSGRIKGNGALTAWLESVGDNLDYVILESVPNRDARRYEEKHIRIKAGEGHRLFNIRQAARKVYTKEQAHQILSASLKDTID